MPRTPNQRIALVAMVVFVLDQLTKLIVLSVLGYAQEKIVIDGFFKFVHWTNTGAAWSLFRDNNEILTIVSLVALLALFLGRKHFDTQTRVGDCAMGMIFGGVLGNILDRLLRGHVVDFLYFYLYRRSGEELGFPAFNVADSGICIGVLMLFILSLQQGQGSQPEPAPSAPKPD